MRILLMLDWNRGRGGAEAYAALLRDGLRAAGDEVRLLTSSAGTAGDGAAEYVAYGTEWAPAQALLQIANPMAARTVRRAVREFRPEVAWVNMFAHHLSPSAVSALGDVPKVLLVSDYKAVCPLGSKLLPDGSVCELSAGANCLRSGCLSFPHWLRDQARYARIAAVVAGFHRVLACSAWVQAELAKNGVASTVTMLPVAPPSASYRRQPAPVPTFFYCGRLDREKGVDVLLRAFARIRGEFPSAVLRMAGAGPRREELVGLAASLDLGDAARFLGWLEPDEVERELGRAWVSVIPSRWAEPQGLVAMEAIVRGVPVIVPSFGGLPEMVEAGVSGLCFEPFGEQPLAECLRQVASGEMRAELSESTVRQAAERFRVKRHIDGLRAVFAEVSAGGVMDRG